MVYKRNSVADYPRSPTGIGLDKPIGGINPGRQNSPRNSATIAVVPRRILKMRRIWIYIIGIALVAAAVVGVMIAKENSQDHTDKTGGSAANTAAIDRSSAFPERKACSIFTLADAKQVLGNSAKGGNNSTTNSSSGDLAVSTCDYVQDTGSNAPVLAGKSASLLVRAPSSGAGITSNQNQFGYLKPADSQPVNGYGDNAYWNPQHGQLNILKNNTWYILSNGAAAPASRSLAQAEQLADLLIAKM